MTTVHGRPEHDQLAAMIVLAQTRPKAGVTVLAGQHDPASTNLYVTFTDNNNTSQRFLANLAGQRSFPFAVSYIPTGMLGAGSLSATSTFTLSYQ